MKKKYKNKFAPLGIIIGVLVLSVFVYLGFKTVSSKFKSYTSQDLKISFQYPKNWYIDDRYQRILLTNYQTSLNKDDHPNSSQIELLISIFSSCFKTIDEDLINPACGEGGPSKRSKIISKESRQLTGGIFYKYTIFSANENTLTYYLVQNGNKILQISKQPDPSQFEKEFEAIINSIEFK